MIRVLHFAQQGDTSGFFPQLARRHDRARFQMFFATLNTIAPWLAQEMAAQGVPWMSGDAAGRAGYPRAALRLAAFLRRHRIDVFHGHLFEPTLVGLAAAVMARTPVRVVTRHYSDYHTRIDKRWHVRLDRLATAAAHRVIAVSHHTATHLVEVEKAPPSKVRVVWNGIDFDRVRAVSAQARQGIRSEFAPDGRPLLITVGRLHPEKGYDDLFRALPLVKARLGRPFVHLVAGAGALEGQYRDLARSLGCDDVVRFLGFRPDVTSLVGAADLMVLPSRAEAFGLAFVEALYLGTPVVGTRVGGIPEIVEDGVDGVLVAPGDVASLAEAVAALIEDEPRRRRLAGAGRGRMGERFRFDRMVRDYEAIYDELLAPRRERA